jgi:DNA-binding IclR family transcriptional regulator
MRVHRASFTMSNTAPKVAAVGTSIDMVQYLKGAAPAGVTEIARAVGVSKSTAFDHLQTLLAAGLVVREGDDYRLGLWFLDLGEYVRQKTELYRVGRPLVDELSEATGEVANMMIPEGGVGVYLYKAMGDNAVRHDTRAGMRIPLHTTAMGKAILAESPPETVEAIVDEHGLEPMTDRTITDRARLRRALKTIRERGYAINEGERNSRLRCVAAPIVVEGQVQGAISVSGPETRMVDDGLTEEYAMKVLETANVIEINMRHF